MGSKWGEELKNLKCTYSGYIWGFIIFCGDGGIIRRSTYVTNTSCFSHFL